MNREWILFPCDEIRDPIFWGIAKRTNSKAGTVIAVYLAMLDCAMHSDSTHGAIDDFDADAFDVLFGFEGGICANILAEMTRSGLVVDGRLARWDSYISLANEDY